jgi:hypothetical protein
MSLKQIKLARRFVSSFIYKTNAMFNTNCLKMLLNVIVSINNTSKTFFITYCYITLESAASFKWIREQLTNLAFYNCLKAVLIYSNFLKGFRAAVAAKATLNLAKTTLIDDVSSLKVGIVLNVTKVIVSKAVSKLALIKLQLCK